eukprot:gene33343-43107_t
MSTKAVDLVIQSIENLKADAIKHHEELLIAVKKTDNIRDSNKRSSSLLWGLGELYGAILNEVKYIGENIRLAMSIGGFQLNFDLDKNMTLFQITSTNSDRMKSLISSILERSKTLSPPEDLRYAVLSIIAAQESTRRLKEDLLNCEQSGNSEIVKVVILPDRMVEMTFPTAAVKARIQTHECYPTIPGGVKVCSLIAEVGCSIREEDLQQVKESIDQQAALYSLVEMEHCLQTLK